MICTLKIYSKFFSVLLKTFITLNLISYSGNAISLTVNNIGLVISRHAKLNRPYCELRTIYNSKNIPSKKLKPLDSVTPRYFNPLNIVALNKLIPQNDSTLPSVLKILNHDYDRFKDLIEVNRENFILKLGNGNLVGGVDIFYETPKNKKYSPKMLRILTHSSLSGSINEFHQAVCNFLTDKNEADYTLFFTKNMDLFPSTTYNIIQNSTTKNITNFHKTIKILELQKYNLKLSELKSMSDHYLYLLKRGESQIKPHKGAPEEVKFAYQLIDSNNFTPSLAEQYRELDDKIMDEAYRHSMFGVSSYSGRSVIR